MTFFTNVWLSRLFVCWLSISMVAAQDLSGFWLGIADPTDPTLKTVNYTISVTQAGNRLTGTAQTADPNLPFGGNAYFSAQVTGNTVQYKEALNSTDNILVDDVCFWLGTLTYNANEESLKGTFSARVNNTTCSENKSGQIELYRIVLRSGTTYCRNTPAKLTVTGKNIRWYNSEKKTQLLATGNSYTPTLAQTTTLYITQTLYQMESPAVPIVVKIVDPPAFTTATTKASCGKTDGILTLTPTTNMAGVQYSINNGAFQSARTFNNLASGPYTVVAKTPEGCEISQTVTVPSEAAPIIDDIKLTQVGCGQQNGSLTVVTGSQTGLQYSANGGAFQSTNVFSGLKPGSYTVVVKNAAGCEAQKTATIAAEIPPTIISLSATQTRCGQPNGVISVVASPATGLQYRLAGNPAQAASTFTGLGPGAYMVVVSSPTGCSVQQATSISPSSSLTAQPPTTVEARCSEANGRIIALATGGRPPLQYRINGGNFQPSGTFDQLAAGTFTLTIRDAENCQLDVPVALTGSTAPTLTLQAWPEGCGKTDGVVSASASGGLAPVEFALNGGTYQAGDSFSGLQANTYTVTVADANDCKVTRQIMVPSDCSSQLILPTAFTPNADQQNDALTVHFRSPTLSIIQFTVFDRWGSVVYSRDQFTVKSGESVWDGQLNNLPAPVGPYQIKVQCQAPTSEPVTYLRSVMLLR